MSHSVKKGLFADAGPLEKIEVQEGSEKKQVTKTWSRRSTIFLPLVGFTIAVYDGRKHVSVYTTEDTVGRRLGEFASIRTFRGHEVADEAITIVGK